jgi:exodeoxyribonuclease V alpha subunit
MAVELTGQIERITYTNGESGYTIAKVRVRGHRDLVTVVGNFMAPQPGEILTMTGVWSLHPRFGEQFKVDQYYTKMPATVSGIKKYLGSGLIKGIGPVMADRIVKKFGQNTLDIIEQDIKKLASVEGIGRKRIQMIQTAWEDQKEIRDLMLFLQSNDVSAGYAPRIFREYGNLAIPIVRENPFRLAMDIFGIGFVTADRIAEKMGFDKNSPLRSQAGIIYVLHQLSEDGHVCCPIGPLLEKCGETLAVDKEVITGALDSLAQSGAVIIDEGPVDPEPDSVKAVYLANFFVSENGIARRLAALVQAPSGFSPVNVDKAVKWVEPRLDIALAPRQIEALKFSLENRVMVLTGGPGTGKTTLIKAMLHIFERMGQRVMLAAPTGRAAKRMSEASGHEARTIHRLLEFASRKGGFQKNENYPLEADILIIDESSMIDTILMHHLLKAVESGTTLILVGDVNQLPSVGAGNVLNDIILSGIAPVVELNEIFRQARTSSIIVNAHRINSGKMPLIDNDRADADFYFIQQEDPQKAVDIILEMVKNRIPRRFGLDPVSDIQVLTPMHKGPAGAGNLNVQLQKALNPDAPGILRGGREFKINDKVMQVKNNYDKDVYNGDIGRIFRIFPEEQEVVVTFENRNVAYDYSDMDELVPAYAVTVHKSQGSEYPAVVVPILTQHYILLQRNLIYTAVTRGKKLVVLVGTTRALAMGIKNNKTLKRFTRLRHRLML